MFTHHKSTICVLCTLMHLSSGHVALLHEEIQPTKVFFQLNLRRRAASRWLLSQIFGLSMTLI